MTRIKYLLSVGPQIMQTLNSSKTDRSRDRSVKKLIIRFYSLWNYKRQMNKGKGNRRHHIYE